MNAVDRYYQRLMYAPDRFIQLVRAMVDRDPREHVFPGYTWLQPWRVS